MQCKLEYLPPYSPDLKRHSRRDRFGLLGGFQSLGLELVLGEVCLPGINVWISLGVHSCAPLDN